MVLGEVEKAVSIGQAIDWLKWGTEDESVATDYRSVVESHERYWFEVTELAKDAGLSERQTNLLLNSYVLARYDALINESPYFMWAQSGILAANTVRLGFVRSYATADAMGKVSRIMSLSGNNVHFLLDEAAEAIRGTAAETLKDQKTVLEDV